MRRLRRRAVVVLPQWNADAEGHVGLCRLMNRFGLSALRLSLPYHDARMPPELRRELKGAAKRRRLNVNDLVLLTLSAVSFDGLSKTFWWLGLGGINPLEFPGRTAVMGRNSLGLLLSWAAW